MSTLTPTGRAKALDHFGQSQTHLVSRQCPACIQFVKVYVAAWHEGHRQATTSGGHEALPSEDSVFDALIKADEHALATARIQAATAERLAQ